MTSKNDEIAQILLQFEDGDSRKYIMRDETYQVEKSGFLKSSPKPVEPVEYISGGEEIFIVSDLHICSGRNNAGVYKGTENFFSDDSFKRFLEFADKKKKTDKGILIINGDVFDFLRVVEYPGRVRKIRLAKRFKQWLKGKPIKPSEPPSEEYVMSVYREWSNILTYIGIDKSPEDLKSSISSKEKKYGLRTDDFKSVWKLDIIKKGHPVFFESLSAWIEKGNKIIIIKGNHDAEWYWPGVRNYFRFLLANNISTLKKSDIKSVLTDIVLPNISFFDDAVVIDKDFYAEHGHRYDKFTVILGKPVLEKNTKELNLPFGSFFNRYLINRVELYYPYLDNVRPTANVLPMLLRDNFPLGLKILFHHIPYTIYIILMGNWRYIRYMFNRVFWFAFFVVIPLAAVVYLNADILWNLYLRYFGDSKATTSLLSFLRDNLLINNLKSFGLILLAYMLSRIVGWFQISEPDTLNGPARKIMNGTNYRISTMGHTHNPGEYIFKNNQRFYNTGTWVPVIETSTADLREDKTYTFLHLVRDKEGKLQPANEGLIQRWTDEAGRADSQILMERKQ